MSPNQEEKNHRPQRPVQSRTASAIAADHTTCNEGTRLWGWIQRKHRAINAGHRRIGRGDARET